ncbi:MAG: BolA/IbaG family iron-sulfur metabolism protein [bacterium]|nr:BolA/IbaG family iron-sulfur metabolism protein [bacterium]
MSELPEGIPRAVEPAPRDSASGIFVRRAADRELEVLLGTRSRRSRFMPGFLAFPGGAVDPEDRAGGGDAFARCVAREVLEETGLNVPVGDWVEAGQRTTPPMFPMRFRNHFFVTAASAEPAPEPATGEFEQLSYVRPRQALADWVGGACRLPPPVLPILRALAECESVEPAEVAASILRANAVEDRAPRIEFTPGLWVVPLRSATLPPATHTNVWLPGDTQFAIVDPGSDEPAEVDRLVEVVQRRRALGHEPTMILLTHHHQDHVDGIDAVAERLKLPVGAHPRVLELLARPGRPIEHGTEINLGRVTLRAHLTPGHAPGHLAYEVVGRRLLIAGDLLSGISTILIDPAHGSMRLYLESLARVRALGAKLLMPGHGPPQSGTEIDRLLDHRAERERKIYTLIGPTPAALAQIARKAYDDVPEMPDALIRRQALSHLVDLEERGLVAQQTPDQWNRAPGADRVERIEARLRERLEPLRLRIRDDSAKHVGHAGATSGGGHYKVEVLSARFENLTLLERHRLVNEALEDLFQTEIHALALRTTAPSDDSYSPDQG